MKVLVTGANGFLGSHIVEKSLKQGHETHAAIRKGADCSHLDQIKGYHRCWIDYEDTEKLSGLLREKGPYDLIIHNAGITRSFSLEQYLQVNAGLTQKLINAIHSAGGLASKGRLVYISSMAALGPVGAGGPVSLYGRSKLAAEVMVKNSRVNYTIFRPTGIYGVRDEQFLPLFKTARFGLYPILASPHQKITLINARDVATNVLNAPQLSINQTIHLDDGQVYEPADLKNVFESLFNRKTLSLRIPPSLVSGALWVNDHMTKLLKRRLKITHEQYHEISQNWNYNFEEERKKNPVKIDYTLNAGFKETLDYYRTRKLI